MSNNVNNNMRKSNKSKTKSNIKSKTKRTYTKKEYNSGDGMLTTVWGPAMWHYLHTMSFNYPINPTAEEKNNYRNFVLNLQHVLPCKYCRINLKTNFKQFPLNMNHMKNRETFSKYIFIPEYKLKARPNLALSSKNSYKLK